MPSFTTEQSLKDTYGDSEVSGLLIDEPGKESVARFEKAAAAAQADIEDYLRIGGYVIPVPYTPYRATVMLVDPATGLDIPYLRANIQAISDCFTAWYLAGATDLAKQRYDKCREEGLAYLEKLSTGELLLTTSGKTVVLARPRIFDISLMRERDVFGYYLR